ncbi:hypothetical protein PTKIN_Ptkin16aG0091500 [Pterospermum kingtungense]
MIFSICKNLLFIRGNFLPNYSLVSLAVRYKSGKNVNGHSFTTSYLINSCGFSPKAALSVPKCVNFQTPEKPDSVISFFEDHGFSQTQIRTLIKRLPELLIYNPQKIFLPKFQFFYGLTHCDDDKVIVAYKQCKAVLANDFQSLIAPKVAVLRECGVPESNILSKLVEHPRLFVSGHEKFERTVEEEWGWSNEEIALAFGRSPNFMRVSEHKIKAAMSFYVNTMGCKSSCIAKCPVLLSLSLHKRLIPRWSLLQVLLSKGLIEKEISLQVLFMSNEKKFLCRFVTPYEDPYLLKLYEEKEWSRSNEEIASAFLNSPYFMMLSENKIETSMSYFVNTMPSSSRIELGQEIWSSVVTTSSLVSKGFNPDRNQPLSIFMCSDKEFLRRFMMPYENPHLLNLYKHEAGHF